MQSQLSLSFRRGFDATALFWVAVAFTLAILILNPIFYLFKESVAAQGDAGGWTLKHYADAFSNPLYYGPIFTTLWISAAVGVLSLVLGAALAWCVSRTDIPMGAVIRNMILASFVTPPFLGAIAWIFLAGPREGWLNVLYRAATLGGSEDHLVNIFSLGGVIFAITLYTFPLVFIVVMAALNNISSDIEDAANIAGGGTFSTMVNITLPLVLPALFAGFIMAVLEAMILFGIPAVLAIPARMHVMTTQIRAFMASEDNLVGLASAYSMPMLAAAVWMVYSRGRVLGKRGFATLGGKGGQRRPQKLGAWRYPVFVLCLIPLLCAVVLPYIALLLTSFMRTLGGGLTWSNMTGANYVFIWNNDAVWSSLGNTLTLAVFAATIAAGLAGVIAYIAQRRLVWGHQYMSFLATLPIAIPGIVLAVGLFAAYTKQPFVLYGTLWIMFFAYLTKYLPLAYQTSNAALASVHPELEECSRILGANRIQVFWDVTVPLFKVGLVASWILVFMPSLRELSASVLLWTTNTKVISVVIIDLYEENLLGPISALGVVLLLITLVAILAGFRLAGRDFMKA